MAWLQLHYTSCKRGLSGYSGFQFCAITQGVSRVMMREVERYTIYEPPTTELASGRPTPANLIYTYVEDMDATIIARVEFTGLDFSDRFGNYFAHTLISTTPAEDLQSVLPVELWDASFWQSGQGSGSDLPPLASPPPTGPITRISVAAFVQSGCTPDQLATLVTLADQAMNAGRQLLVIGDNTGQISMWIAAAAYLLKPSSAKRLTFSTYEYDPLRCRTHIVGTVPGTRPLRPDRTAGFHIFDLVNGELPAIPSIPAAVLLARLGVVAAAEVWNLTGSLGAPPELPLGDALAILASAALVLGEALTVGEFSTAIEWLDTADGECSTSEHLSAAVLASFSQPLTELPALRKQQLVALAQRVDRASEQQRDIAESAGNKSMTSRLEAAIVAMAMDAAGEGRPPGDGIALRDLGVRQAAAQRCAALLMTADAAQSLNLLVWAAASGAEPISGVIRQVGRDTIVSAILATADLPGLVRVAHVWPDLRAGMVEGIAALSREDQHRLIAGPAARGLHARDFADHPELGEDWVITQANAGRIPPAKALAYVMAFRRSCRRNPAVDECLVGRLWPRDQWTAAEAVEVIGLPPEEIGTEAVTARLATLLLHVPERAAERDWIALVGLLVTLPPGVLPPSAAEQAAELAELIELIENAARLQQSDTVIAELIRHCGAGSAVADDFIHVQLPPLLTSYRKLGTVLASWRDELFGRFCEYLREAENRGKLSVPVLASIFVAMQRLEVRYPEHANLLSDEVLAPMLRTWPRADIAALGIEADRIAADSSILIDLWFLKHDQSRRRRLPRIRRRDT